MTRHRPTDSIDSDLKRNNLSLVGERGTTR